MTKPNLMKLKTSQKNEVAKDCYPATSEVQTCEVTQEPPFSVTPLLSQINNYTLSLIAIFFLLILWDIVKTFLKSNENGSMTLAVRQWFQLKIEKNKDK